jgi:putative pre-16S rRNA nuclease
MPATPEQRASDWRSANEDASVLLAFDFGRRRIGVAAANTRTRTASPLRAVSVGATLPWTELDRLVTEWHPRQLVVGIPESSTSPALPQQIREFVAALETRYAIPVATVDEALTSRTARSELAEQRRSGFLRRQVRRGKVDSFAACLIAEQWLNDSGSAQCERE